MRVVVILICVVLASSCTYARLPSDIARADKPSRDYSGLSCDRLYEEHGRWEQEYRTVYDKQLRRRTLDRVFTGLGWGLGVFTFGIYGLFGLGYQGDVPSNVSALAQAKADLHAINATVASKGCK